MRKETSRDPQNPPAWHLLLTGFLLALLIIGAFFSEDLIWRFVFMPKVDYSRTGMQVFQMSGNFLEGKSLERRLVSESRFKATGHYRSALGVAALRLNKPETMHFLLECDDFGNVGINGHKFINQGKRVSPHHISEAQVELEAGTHLLLVELNNLAGTSWITLKTRDAGDGEWGLLGAGSSMHPLVLSNFPTWWKAIPLIENSCTALLITFCPFFLWYFRGWTPLFRLYGAIRRGYAGFWHWEAGFDSSYLKRMIFVFPIVLFVAMLAVKIWDHAFFRHVAWEDGSFEYIQFWCYALATVLSLAIVIMTTRQRLFWHCTAYSILFAGLFFITMEEISWGQRIFDFENPEFFAENNVQREMSFHNLNMVAPFLHDMYIVVGLYGALAWIVLGKLNLDPTNLINFCVPDWFMASFFAPAFVVYTIYTYIVPYGSGYLGIDEESFWSFFALYDQEGVELLLSMGFLVFTTVNCIRLRRICKPVAPWRVKQLEQVADLG